MRALPDSGFGAAAHAESVHVDDLARIARADLTMIPGLTLDAALAGRVVADSADAPLAGAEVMIPDLRVSTVTGASGEFLLSGIPPGTHRIVIRRPGFTAATATVGFAANQTVEHHIVLRRSGARPGIATLRLRRPVLTGVSPV